MGKENKQTYTFACQPSVVKRAKEKAANEGTNLSSKVQSLLNEYVHPKGGIASTVGILAEALKDKDYYYSWQANIAMQAQDEFARFKKNKRCITSEDMHTIANNAAKNFLNLLIRQ